jgi:polyferredoxin
MNILTTVKRRYRWGLALVMLLVLGGGWKYPFLGFVVPVVMISGLFGASFRGRIVCGKFCPRGSFFDTWFKPLGGSARIPPLLTSPRFRWSILVLLFSFMGFQLASDAGDPAHWGLVFWRVCLITSLIALTVGVIYRPRAWCSFCPMGTIQGAIAGTKHPLRIAPSCAGCGICEKSCPMGYEIAKFRENGRVANSDCLHCGECSAACPLHALH